MKIYLNKQGHSGVTDYEANAKSVTVTFNNSSSYLYTYKSAGKKTIEKMKLLAAAGRGLSTYISRFVKNKFEKKLP